MSIKLIKSAAKEADLICPLSPLMGSDFSQNKYLGNSDTKSQRPQQDFHYYEQLQFD